MNQLPVINHISPIIPAGEDIEFLTHAKASQCVGRLRRLEATGVQRRKEGKL